MIHFVHTADIHFGMENYGFIEQSSGLHTRLLDFQIAFDQVINFAIEKQVDLFIFAGDAYKTSCPTPTHQKLLLQAFMKLYCAQIPVVIVIGNHDHSGNNAKAHALDLFHHLPFDGFYIFSRPESIIIKTKSGPIQIVGIPWPTRSMLSLDDSYMFSSYEDVTHAIEDSLRYLIKDFSSRLDGNIPAILVGHLTVSTAIFSGSERRALTGRDPVLHVSDLAIHPFNYVALGHLHRHQNLNDGGLIPVVYSGSPEKIDFGEVNDEKGFCYGTIQNGICTYEFIKILARHFLEIHVDLKSNLDFTEQIISKLKNHLIEDAVVKITYKLPPEMEDSVDAGKVKNACHKAWYFAGLHCVNPYTKQKVQRILLSNDISLEKMIYLYCKEHEKFESQTTKYLELLEKYKGVN